MQKLFKYSHKASLKAVKILALASQQEKALKKLAKKCKATRLTLSSLQGKVTASSDGKSIGLDISDRKYFSDALNGEGRQSLILSRTDGQSYLVTSCPIYVDSKIVAVLSHFLKL